MAAIGRGRSLKNLRIRGKPSAVLIPNRPGPDTPATCLPLSLGRNDSGEENVPLDLTRGNAGRRGRRRERAAGEEPGLGAGGWGGPRTGPAGLLGAEPEPRLPALRSGARGRLAGPIPLSKCRLREPGAFLPASVRSTERDVAGLATFLIPWTLGECFPSIPELVQQNPGGGQRESRLLVVGEPGPVPAEEFLKNSLKPSDNLREILQNVAKLQGVSNMRKLGHLNNFTKLLCDIGHSEEKLGFNYEDIIICLRLALLNEAKEVRAAGLRALRYLIQDSSILQKVLKLKVDYLIARCIDIQQSNEVERTQALRLVRKMITVNASLFPSSVANSLIAVGNDGLQERDRMVRACIAIICELALQNPEVVALRGGLNTILKNVIDCQLSRINEALITTILHLLNHPKTRQYVRADVELEVGT
ncbi:rapamycin-insensitive companion of mTOR-like [Orycteropus afer afer]|uniref:Rapamycin-insensitive companion of mTOR-like n=1 Tax=Orycteropus afer afer TaxID=1230840 RepID=A0AC54ZBR9_ORYAF|nr:rapamycin-insensitive companion of mTOR-like [Orycteropus afer afer]